MVNWIEVRRWVAGTLPEAFAVAAFGPLLKLGPAKLMDCGLSGVFSIEGAGVDNRSGLGDDLPVVAEGDALPRCENWILDCLGPILRGGERGAREGELWGEGEEDMMIAELFC